MASMALFGVGAGPADAQLDLVDPGLDSIMQTAPDGFERSTDDRIPAGSMTGAEFSKIGDTDIPELDDDAVFYGATYEKADGSIMVAFGMSTSKQRDGQQFANGVIDGTPTKGALSTGIDGIKGVEGDVDGAHTVVVSFARNGRGFAVIAFGPSVRDDALRFAGSLAGAAQSTPTRSDSATTDASVAALIGSLFFFAMLAIAIVGLTRFVRRKKSRARGAMSMAAGPSYGMPMNPWGQNTAPGSPPHPVHAGFPPPPPSSSPPPPPPPPPSPW
ncbi:MAG: hypothetical protein ABI658_05155 [Acidimicrobiales bacterium]